MKLLLKFTFYYYIFKGGGVGFKRGVLCFEEDCLMIMFEK